MPSLRQHKQCSTKDKAGFSKGILGFKKLLPKYRVEADVDGKMSSFRPTYNSQKSLSLQDILNNSNQRQRRKRNTLARKPTFNVFNTASASQSSTPPSRLQDTFNHRKAYMYQPRSQSHFGQSSLGSEFSSQSSVPRSQPNEGKGNLITELQRMKKLINKISVDQQQLKDQAKKKEENLYRLTEVIQGLQEEIKRCNSKLTTIKQQQLKFTSTLAVLSTKASKDAVTPVKPQAPTYPGSPDEVVPKRLKRSPVLYPRDLFDSVYSKNGRLEIVARFYKGLLCRHYSRKPAGNAMQFRPIACLSHFAERHHKLSESQVPL